MRLIEKSSAGFQPAPERVGIHNRAAYGTVRTLRRAATRTILRIVSLAFMAVWLAAARAEVRVGDAFPALKTAELTGGEVPAVEGKVALVDFWASWCAPCKASFPALARLHTEFASRGLVIVGVSVDERSSAFTAFVKKQQPPFATLLDAQHKLVETLHVPVMPTSYLIGRDGRVRFLHAGFHGAATEQELHSQIETLLAESAGSKS